MANPTTTKQEMTRVSKRASLLCVLPRCADIHRVLLALALWGAFLASGSASQLETNGVLVYHDPSVPNYIETFFYNQNSRKNLFDGELITTSGSRRTYKLDGVIADIEYPIPKSPASIVTANLNIQRVNDLLAQYPQQKPKLQPVLMAWQTALQFENNRLKNASKNQPGEAASAGTASKPGALSSFVVNGESYEGVTLSSVDEDAVSVVHSAGVAKFKLAALSKEQLVALNKTSTTAQVDPEWNEKQKAKQEAEEQKRQAEIEKIKKEAEIAASKAEEQKRIAAERERNRAEEKKRQDEIEQKKKIEFNRDLGL